MDHVILTIPEVVVKDCCSEVISEVINEGKTGRAKILNLINEVYEITHTTAATLNGVLYVNYVLVKKE